MSIVHLVDADTGSTADISLERGLNCFRFRPRVNGTRIDALDCVDDFPDGGRPSGSGIPILFPFPNRIRDRRFEWQGRSYEIPEDCVNVDRNGHAIHGFCLDRPWRIASQSESEVLARFQLSVDAPERRPYWPADFRLDVRYALHGSSLISDFRIQNPDRDPLPWGLGTHAYFRLPLSAESSPATCLVQAPVTRHWQLDECLPTLTVQEVPAERDLRDGCEFGRLQLDDLFSVDTSGLSVDAVIMDAQAGLQLVQQSSPCFPFLVAFTPPNRPAVCLEPYTCLTDAVNLAGRGVATGWQTLLPGGEFRCQIRLTAGLVIA